MLKRRFLPYIIGIVGACIVVILFVSPVKERQTLIEKAILESETQHEHTHGHGEDDQSKSFEPSPYIDIAPSEEEESEELKKKEELDKKFLELREWIHTGKLTPTVEQDLNRRAEWRQENDIVLDVIQRIVTPDGTLHQVVVPKFQQYEEGDAILKSELVDEEYLRNNYRNEEETETAKGDAVTVNNVTYPMPDEYYAIESPYEQLEYVNKFITTIDLGISMDEVEQKIATGELDVSLTESDKRLVDRREARQERYRLLDVGAPKNDTVVRQAAGKSKFSSG